MRHLVPALLALSAPAAAQDVAHTLALTYLCEGGAVLQVAYLNPAEGPSLAVVYFSGRLIPMQSGRTASGVRYVAFDEASGFVWHTKGDEGFLAVEDADDMETVLDGCRRAGG